MARSTTACVLLATIALASACSSTSNPTNGSAASTSQALKFAECMRTHGVSDFPDPGPSGDLTIDGVANGSSIDTNSTAFQQAISACRQLEPAGFTGRPRTAQQQEAALKFAQCVRAHGVPDFPDPAEGQPLIDTYRIPSSNTPAGMSALNAATQKCHTQAAAAMANR